MNFIKIDTIFINSENGKTFYPLKLLLNIAYKIKLARSGKYVALPNLSAY